MEFKSLKLGCEYEFNVGNGGFPTMKESISVLEPTNLRPEEMTTARDRASRIEIRDSNRKSSPSESAFQELKVEMRRSNQLLLEALAQINAKLANLEPGLESRETERGDLNPPVEIGAKSSAMKSRYHDLKLNRNDVVDNRVDRFECPGYCGTTDFRSWLYKCEQYLDINRIPANRMVRFVSFKLEGLALEWHQSFMEDKQDRSVSWDEYVRNMSLRFDFGRNKDLIVQNREVSMTDDSTCVLHEETNVSKPDLQLLDMPLELVAEFEEMDEVELDAIIESGNLESEMVEEMDKVAIDAIKEECRIDLDDVSQATVVKDQVLYNEGRNC